jgi:hypothetical protein
MDGTLKALLTSLTVAVVLALARRAGSATAGLFAGLPTITAPTLAWLAHDRGVAFAAAPAVSGTAVCAMLAGFALGYTRAPRRGGAATAFVCGTLISAVTVAIGPLLGTFAAGPLSSMPVISGAAALSEHVAHGPVAAATFRHGYVDGLIGKAVFGVAFALAVAPLGTTWALCWPVPARQR